MAQLELADHANKDIVNIAYAHRIAQTDNDNWKKFVKANEPKKPKDEKPKQMSADDHRAVIARLKGR